nr:hypothetical protein [Tanacetum cinerariifolium]
MPKSFHELNSRDTNIPNLIATITHYLCHVIVTEFDRTKKFVDEIGELRAISGHVVGAAGVQIPENNLDNLHSSIEED